MQAFRLLTLAALVTFLVSENFCQAQVATLTKGESKEAADKTPSKSEAEVAEDFHGDFLRDFQFKAVDSGKCEWCHWGDRAGKFSNWTNHSNRLVPIYTWGIKLDAFDKANSCYRSEERLKEIYGRLPDETLNPDADYFDQTDIYRYRHHFRWHGLADDSSHRYLSARQDRLQTRTGNWPGVS